MQFPLASIKTGYSLSWRIKALQPFFSFCILSTVLCRSCLSSKQCWANFAFPRSHIASLWKALDFIIKRDKWELNVLTRLPVDVETQVAFASFKRGNKNLALKFVDVCSDWVESHSSYSTVLCLFVLINEGESSPFMLKWFVCATTCDYKQNFCFLNILKRKNMRYKRAVFAVWI